jgi:hypothetical protein
MNMFGGDMRMLSTIFAVCLTTLLVGCGGSGGNVGSVNSGGGSVFVTGKWTLVAFEIIPNEFGPAVEFDMNFTQSGNTISSDSDNTVDNAICGGTHVDSSAGTVTGNQFKLLLTINTETISVTGTLSADGKSMSITDSNFTSSPNGPCFNGTHGNFTANFVPPFTGSFSGTMIVSPILGTPTVTAMFTEDTNFNLSGSLMVTGNPCFTSLATAPSKPGISIGSLSSFEMTDGTNVLDFSGHILTAAAPMGFEYDGEFDVTSGCTEEFDGQISLDPATSSAAVAATSKPKSTVSTINPVLVERLKVLAALRHEHENLR